MKRPGAISMGLLVICAAASSVRAIRSNPTLRVSMLPADVIQAPIKPMDPPCSRSCDRYCLCHEHGRLSGDHERLEHR